MPHQQRQFFASGLLVFFYAFFSLGQSQAQFTTIYNVPPDTAPASIGSDTQLNLSAGGSIGFDFNAGATNGSSVNAEVNISGGWIEIYFDAYSGSTVNISGGTGFRLFEAHSGSAVNVSGGRVFGASFHADGGSTLNVSGGELRLNDTLISGLDLVGNSVPLNIPSGSALTGTLADGTPFALSSTDYDLIADGTLTLVAATLPAIGPTIINLPADPVPAGIRSGQNLNIDVGAVLGENFNAGWGSTVNINGGTIDENFETAGAQVNISSGKIDSFFDAYYGSTVNLTGGRIDSYAEAHDGSVINVSGGYLGYSFYARSGSVVNLSGGSIGYWTRAFSGSTINVSGGSIGYDFDSYPGSAVNLYGDEFRLDGVLISELETSGEAVDFNLPYGSVLSGIHTDGTAFAFSSLDGDQFYDGTITLTTTAIPSLGSEVIVLPTDPKPLGIRNGQTLIVESGGDLGANFNAGYGSKLVVNDGQVGIDLELDNAHLSITGGTIGTFFTAFGNSIIDISGGSIDEHGRVTNGCVVNLSGGLIGNTFTAYTGSTVNVSGGRIDGFFSAEDGSVVNVTGGEVAGAFYSQDGSIVSMSGGTIGPNSRAYSGSIINVTGGTLGSDFTAQSTSIINISGGSIDDDYHAFAGNETNIFGTQFILDGLDITSTLITNLSSIITARDVTLSGLLADGSPFSFDLNSIISTGADYFDPTAILAITLVQPGDFNGSLNVDGADFLKWQCGLADLYNATDFANWESNFGSTAPAIAGSVPEPTTNTLLFLALVAIFARRIHLKQ